MSRPYSPRLLLAGLLLGVMRPAAAASCLFSTGSTLVDFGFYSALTGASDKTGQVLVTCTPTLGQLTASYTITISPGLSGDQLDRKMFQATSALRYNLYLEPSRTNVIGSGSGGTVSVTGNCTGLCSVPIYGRLIGGQSGPAGPYSDTVSVVINF